MQLPEISYTDAMRCKKKKKIPVIRICSVRHFLRGVGSLSEMSCLPIQTQISSWGCGGTSIAKLRDALFGVLTK